jgi:hypothetical protein
MMKIQRTILAAITLASTCLLNLSAFGQGALTPPGAPSPTMKSLDQIEARTAITNTSSLVTISQPGSYYLTHNLTVSNGDAIDIKTDGVTLDLNGFTIASTAASANGTAINLTNLTGDTDLTILNGHILGSVTNNGSGVYSGGGFANGINYYSTPPQNILVSRLTVSGCQNYGVNLFEGSSTVVEACTVRTTGSYGIYATTVKSCVATDCGGAGIAGDEVSDSRGQTSGNSYGLYANGVAQNCYGISAGGTGLFATLTAQNCSGLSTSGTGLTATTTVNCWGQSNGGGTGLSATTAQNCYGYSNGGSGTGLSATTAQNCSGYSNGGSGTGLSASKTATSCYGYSSSGTGLSAFIANSCSGGTSSGTTLNVTHNLNSY